MRLITWNLRGQSRALALLVPHAERLAATESVVVCLQEAPDHVLAAAGSGNPHLGNTLLRVAQKRVTSATAILYSGDLTAQAVVGSDSERLLLATFSTPTGSAIQVCSYHAHSRIFRTSAEERGGLAALLRREIDGARVPGTPLAILGDFNAQLHDREIDRRACWYAIDASQVRHGDIESEHFGRKSEPLFIVPPSGMPGSLYVKWGDELGWKTYDFAVVDEVLHGRVRDSRILNAVDGVSLMAPRSGLPWKRRYSDHLPVEVALDFS